MERQMKRMARGKAPTIGVDSKKKEPQWWEKGYREGEKDSLLDEIDQIKA